jgi:hypothetical protein
VQHGFHRRGIGDEWLRHIRRGLFLGVVHYAIDANTAQTLLLWVTF